MSRRIIKPVASLQYKNSNIERGVKNRNKVDSLLSYDKVKAMKRNHNFSVIENNLSPPINAKGMKKLDNQQSKNLMAYDKNFHVNRDTSEDNILRNSNRKAKVSKALKNFTHNYKL